ncbi:aldo/keto reductase [Arthrobacter yangruifuii]|uniref:aldo/keto reductase n=1 Tax=Arthrobacter yangruifuii TaxID=2606616 RepID=UPI0011B3EC1E|nr:aldo/keto reductase [Arthrobacter yangruifuii]
MTYAKLGRSGAVVSAIGLGCLGFGDPGRGTHSWTLREEEASSLLRHAVELGINFFDTANVYSAGHSEEILGAAVAQYCRRDEVVIATKVHGEMGPGPNGWGLSRKHILWQVEQSLRRLGTDYIDLYQVHRWDAVTPLEETLETLDLLVRDGKVRYLGASSMRTWQFAKALFLQEQHGWAPFVTMQNHYNLLYREEEREMYPFCADRGVGALPYSPLARGRLARPWGDRTVRQDHDLQGQELYRGNEEVDRSIIDAVGNVAEGLGATRAQVALAWVLANPVVTAPVVGATDAYQLDDTLKALDIQLTEEEFGKLEEFYRPRPVAGF